MEIASLRLWRERDKWISTSVLVSFICPVHLYNAEEPEGNSCRSHSATKNIINPAWVSANIYRSAPLALSAHELN